MKLYPSPAHTALRRIALATDLYQLIGAARKDHQKGARPDLDTIYTQTRLYTGRDLSPPQRAYLTQAFLDPGQDPAVLLPDPDPTVTLDHLHQLHQDPDLPGLYLGPDWSITTDPTDAHLIVDARHHHENEHGGEYSTEELLSLYNQHVHLLTRAAYNRDRPDHDQPPEPT